MMNNVQLQGRMCFVNYKAGETDASGNETKKAFISFSISYNTGRKEKPTDQYNKEILFRCKAFGKQADFIYNNFQEKSQILVDATLDMGADYEDKNGQLQKGGVELMIKSVHFCGPKETTAVNDIKSPAPQIKPVAPIQKPAKPSIKPITPKIAGK